ncbi:hypothetical protein ACTFIZ_007682 [Dictyostelium cf. discoideum]
MSKFFISFIFFLLSISNVLGLNTNPNVPTASSVTIKDSKNLDVIGHSFGSNFSELIFTLGGQECIKHSLTDSRLNCSMSDSFKTFNNGNILSVPASFTTSIFQIDFVVFFLPGLAISYQNRNPFSCENGFSDENTGICHCNYGYVGNNCDYIQIYVTEVYSITLKEYGSSQLYFLVGNFNSNKPIDSLLIGGEECKPIEGRITSDQIYCESNVILKGLNSISISQNFFYWSGSILIQSK